MLPGSFLRTVGVENRASTLPQVHTCTRTSESAHAPAQCPCPCPHCVRTHTHVRARASTHARTHARTRDPPSPTHLSRYPHPRPRPRTHSHPPSQPCLLPNPLLHARTLACMHACSRTRLYARTNARPHARSRADCPPPARPQDTSSYARTHAARTHARAAGGAHTFNVGADAMRARARARGTARAHSRMYGCMCEPSLRSGAVASACQRVRTFSAAVAECPRTRI